MTIDLWGIALMHCIYGHLRAAFVLPTDAAPSERDRGAVSLEQVLWFVAAGVAVAVIAGILWGKIRDEANKPVNAPSAP
jgi:hypothetical protein